MRLAQWSPLLTFAFAACSMSSPHDPTTGGDDDPGTTDTDTSTTPQDGSGSDSPTTSCAVSGAPGTFAIRAEAYAPVVAADHDGNVFYAAAGSVTKLDPTLAPVFTYPHGDVVAVDAHGNAFVAGAFRAPTDFGTGVVAPAGNVDVYVVKLSPSGEVLAVMTLGECGGDGILDLALDASTGRIAVSGTAMGTVVIDANGALVFQLAPAGKLALDTHGNLVIAGVFAGGIDLGNGHRLSTTGSTDFDGFVARYGADGRYQLSAQLGDVALPFLAPWGETITTPQNQAIADVATGPDDSIAITGTFIREIDVLGQTLSAIPSATESGPFAGTFTAKLESTGTLRFAQGPALANEGTPIGGLVLNGPATQQHPGNAIAVNASGDVFVSNNEAGNVPPFSYPQLTKLDGTTGAIEWGLYNSAGPPGAGLGVAVDGCGNVVWADSEVDLSVFETHYFVSKLAP